MNKQTRLALPSVLLLWTVSSAAAAVKAPLIVSHPLIAESVTKTFVKTEHLARSASANVDRPEVLANDIDRMSRNVALLESERDRLRPFEQHTVDRIVPLLQDAGISATEGRPAQVTADCRQIAKRIATGRKYERLRVKEIRMEQRIWRESNQEAHKEAI